MEPNNFENKIKEKLGSRELKPTEMAWDRLDAMLTVQENQKKKKNFSWIYIAASFFILASVGFWMLNNERGNNMIIDKNNVVFEKSTSDSIRYNKVIDKNGHLLEEDKVTKKSEGANWVNNSLEIKKKQEYKVVEKTIVYKDVNSGLVMNKDPEKKEEKETSIKNIKPDNLLATLENIQVTKENNKFKLKVSSSSLLESAEKNQDKDYKETNVDKLTRNFNQVKSLLANRNYETDEKKE
ncbi:MULTISPECIES: hypothetical protein [Flavobacterium]|uniref:Anti-sigma factor n=1 Tax=Flavobacterium jumunjinense TaxID=998845 RepID=A0ABV5GTA6_9FLAO|nr:MULTISPECIES: hypothetical protein [Flavobacterium]